MINVIGLAIGIAGATLLMMYVNDEMSYDTFHSEASRTYRVLTYDYTTEEARLHGRTFPQLSDRLANELSEIEEEVTIYRTSGQINFRLGQQRITEENWWIADGNFFEFFDFELLRGDPATVLRQPRSIVLSERLAKKYFGDKDPIGKTISEFDHGDLQVTGVFKEVPDNSHLKFDLIVGFDYQTDEYWSDYFDSWNSPQVYSYLKLVQGSEGISKRRLTDAYHAYRGANVNERFEIGLQAIGDIHFDSENVEFGAEGFAKGDRSYIVIFSAIALFLIVIASVNYMNLATARATYRAKEIGIRKVVGAEKRQLALQFLLESLLLTFVAAIVAIGLIDLVLPYYSQITNKNFSLSLETFGEYAPLLIGVTLISGLLAGIYPALFITKFGPINILKRVTTYGRSGVSFRKILVVFQFTLSIVMIVTTIVVSDQMNFIKNSNPGYKAEGLLIVDINSSFSRRDFKLMKRELSEVPGVASVSAASRIPGEWKTITTLHTRRMNDRDSIRSFYMSFDADMQDVFGFELAQGSYFSGDDKADSTSILLNEAAVKAMGLDNPIGQHLKVFRRANRQLNAKVIGVVKDFKYQSFHESVAPLIIGYWNNGLRVIDYFALRLSTSDVSSVIGSITKVHNQFDPATTIEYNLLDEQLALKYEKEQTAKQVFQLGSGLSILVACLGLFGLASFTVQSRTKELGIRKVLGAGLWNLLCLLSSSFAGLVLLAIVLASPIAYYLMNSWLNNFEFRIGISPVPFLIAGLATIVIAYLTIGSTVYRAARNNPVDSLKNE